MHAVLAICVGACAGALARWWLGLALNQAGAWIPWGTLAANLIGAYAIGLILAWAHHTDMAPWLRLMLVTGFLGALTTFSSFSAEVVEMALADRWGAALATVALHLGGSLVLTFAGILSARFLIAASA